VQWIKDVSRFFVEFDYVDRSGTQAEVARLDVEYREDDGWRVRRVHFRREGDPEPYVLSG